MSTHDPRNTDTDKGEHAYDGPTHALRAAFADEAQVPAGMEAYFAWICPDGLRFESFGTLESDLTLDIPLAPDEDCHWRVNTVTIDAREDGSVEVAPYDHAVAYGIVLGATPAAVAQAEGGTHPIHRNTLAVTSGQLVLVEEWTGDEIPALEIDFDMLTLGSTVAPVLAGDLAVGAHTLALDEEAVLCRAQANATTDACTSQAEAACEALDTEARADCYGEHVCADEAAACDLPQRVVEEGALLSMRVLPYE